MKPTRTRHVVLWLTVIAYMITYMDRAVISTARSIYQKDLHLDTVTMGWVISSFYVGYSLFQIPGGWLGDKIGPRRALTVIVTSVEPLYFTHGDVLERCIATRLPVSVRCRRSRRVCRRQRDRCHDGCCPPSAYAQGITHAGSRLGGAITPAIVTWIIAMYDWRTAFVAFGVLGVIWAVGWFVYYRDMPSA